MSDHTYHRFPQHIAVIETLQAKDPTFHEVCSDYEEICTWLAAGERRSESLDPEELHQARELKRDLEDEILSLLEYHHVIVS